MNCEQCKKEIIEGNFVQVPVQVRTAQGIISNLLHIVCCDECSKTIQYRIVGSAKVIEAELIKEN